ncbi:MAG: hypothetical protein HYZ73_01265 [Elusimicrobia bacterium]|nr:hypothetical protein [Elusimicrobiota bacterium]
MTLRSFRSTLWFTSAFLVFHAAILLWWRCVDTRPPAWDPTNHLQLALDYRDALTQARPVTSHWYSGCPVER